MPAVAREFAFDGQPCTVVREPGGHINQSFRVCCSAPHGAPEYLVQRLNPHVFPDAGAVMANISAVTNHIQGTSAGRRTHLPLQHALRLVPTRSGKSWLTCADGAVWRAYPYLAGRATEPDGVTPAVAHAAGLAFGTFLELLNDYAGPPLASTVPHFHDTAWYFDRLETAAREDAARRGSCVSEELDSCLCHRALVSELPASGSADVPVRVAHNDAKAANVLLDARGHPLAVVDLDTVMPGSALSDAGDLIRSLACPAAEDEPELSRVRAEPALVLAALDGWFAGAGAALTERERASAVLAGLVITLEQAVRFLTDYLQGDVYYGAADPEQNLRRTRTQLHLFRSLLTQRRNLERAAIHLPTPAE